MHDLPLLNALLNAVSAALLMAGYVQIKRKKPEIHKRFMLAALSVSMLFLISYLVYHYNVGSVPYPHHDWTRIVYFAILIPHIILAPSMIPFILLAVWHAWRQNFQKHVRIVRWIFPVWMFVSLSGIVIYVMLYRL